MNTMINPPNEAKSYSCIRLASIWPYAYFFCHSIPSILSEEAKQASNITPMRDLSLTVFFLSFMIQPPSAK